MTVLGSKSAVARPAGSCSRANSVVMERPCARAAIYAIGRDNRKEVKGQRGLTKGP